MGPKKTVKIFQIFNLILQSVDIFGQKFTLDQEKQVELQGGKSHIMTRYNGGEQEISSGNVRPGGLEPCNNNHQGLILVKFAKLSLPYDPMANTTIKR